MTRRLTPVALLLAAVGCATLAPMVYADTTDLPPEAATFTDDQKATVGAAFLGLTPDVLAAAGLTPEQVAQVQADINGVDVFNTIITEAVQMDQDNTAAQTQQQAKTPVTSPVPIHVAQAKPGHSLLVPLASLAVGSVLSSNMCDLSPSSFTSFSTPFLAFAMISTPPAANTSTTSTPASAHAKSLHKHRSFDQLQSDLRTSCLKSLSKDNASRVQKCIQAVRDGIPPEYAQTYRTQRERAMLQSALADEQQAKMLGKPLDQTVAQRLQAIRNKPQYIQAHASKRANIATIRNIMGVPDSGKSDGAD